jgi:hypothetical protein
MNATLYQKVSGTVFAIVALAHLYRIVNGIAINVGDAFVPMAFSYLGFLIPGALSVWAFRLSGSD